MHRSVLYYTILYYAIRRLLTACSYTTILGYLIMFSLLASYCSLFVCRVIDDAAGKVPVLKDGDKLVPDSGAIVEYLEATYPDPSTATGEGGSV